MKTQYIIFEDIRSNWGLKKNVVKNLYRDSMGLKTIFLILKSATVQKSLANIISKLKTRGFA